MMLTPCLVCIIFVATAWGLPTITPKNHCKCVPNQWEGILSSTDREFDLKGGQAGFSENDLQIHYDFENKRFAMTDLKTGSSAIADYNKGYKYVIRGNTCHGIHTGETMRQMCLPESADFLGQFTLGTSVPVDLWEFNGPFNTSMKTAVLHDDCIPVSEEIYMSRSGYVSVTSSVYLNIKLGIADTQIFSPPGDCIVQPMDPQRPHFDEQEKRSPATDAADLLKALRQRLYILN